MREIESETEWYVITGSLSCGKTSVTNYLAFHNYHVIPEAARLIIDQGINEGKTIAEMRADEANFQKAVLDKKVGAEERIPSDQLTFWDRGIPDTTAYWQMLGFDGNFPGDLTVVIRRRYKGIFLLDRLPRITADYARTEDEEFAKKLHNLIRETYIVLNYDVVTVPVMPVDQRARFILDRL